MRAVTTILALLAGCGTPADTGEPAGGDTAVDAGLEPPPPSLDAEGVAAEIEGLLAPGLPEAATLLDDWRALFVGTTPGCPAITGDFSIAAPFDGCLATDGREWAGYAVYAATDSGGVDVALTADVTVTNVDGSVFLAAGEVTLTVDADGAFAWMVVGTWGGHDTDDWTEPVPSVSLWASGTPTTATIEGGVSVGQHALYLDDVTWDAGTCPGGSGSLRVRDPGGWWYELSLGCDGCGPVTYEGTSLGEVCPDVGALVEAMVARERAAL